MLCTFWLALLRGGVGGGGMLVLGLGLGHAMLRYSVGVGLGACAWRSGRCCEFYLAVAWVVPGGFNVASRWGCVQGVWEQCRCWSLGMGSRVSDVGRWDYRSCSSKVRHRHPTIPYYVTIPYHHGLHGVENHSCQFSSLACTCCVPVGRCC